MAEVSLFELTIDSDSLVLPSEFVPLFLQGLLDYFNMVELGDEPPNAMEEFIKEMIGLTNPQSESYDENMKLLLLNIKGLPRELLLKSGIYSLPLDGTKILKINPPTQISFKIPNTSASQIVSPFVEIIEQDRVIRLGNQIEKWCVVLYDESKVSN